MIFFIHSISDAILGPKGMPDVKTGNRQLFFRSKKPVMFHRSDSRTRKGIHIGLSCKILSKFLNKKQTNKKFEK